MPAWLPTLIFIFAAMLVIDAIGSFIMWRYIRDRMFFKAAIGWSANFVNFAIHGAFQTHAEMTLVGHSFYFITACCLSMILADATSQKYQVKKFVLAGILMVLFSQLVFMKTGSYFWSALIIDIFISAPLFYFSFRAFMMKDTEVVAKVLAVFLVLNGIHFLDYPFLYDSPTGSIIGFSVAFVLCFMDSVLLPNLILQIRARKYANELEQIVADRTIKLSERTQELEVINKDNVTLLSIVCHDISTPVTIANYGVAQLISKMPFGSGKEADLINRVDKSLKAVTEILLKVKDLHASKLGKLEPKIQALDIEPLIYEVTQMFKPRCEEKGIEIFVTSRDASKKVVMVDPVLFKNQILANLISNAIKFSQAGNRIDVNIYRKNDFINVEIIDQGIGIEQSKLANLFNFNLATTSVGTNSESGTGLGLPTVKIIVEKMGGLVSIHSNTTINSKSDHAFKEVGTVISLNLRSAA